MLVSLLALAGSVAALPRQAPLERPHRETREEAAVSARHLAQNVLTGTMASVFPEDATMAGYPFALMEPRLIVDAPCFPDGDLTFIRFPISQMTKNIDAAQGRATYTLQTPLQKHRSEYGQPRVAFIGNLTTVHPDDKERKRLEECYLEHHPDARWWLPGDPDGAHVARWARFSAQDIYYIGGFGTTGWIGHIPLELYRKARVD